MGIHHKGTKRTKNEQQKTHELTRQCRKQMRITKTRKDEERKGNNRHSTDFPLFLLFFVLSCFRVFVIRIFNPTPRVAEIFRAKILQLFWGICFSTFLCVLCVFVGNYPDEPRRLRPASPFPPPAC